MKNQDWLDQKYPDKERRKWIGEIYLNEPSLSGELDLSDFINEYGVKIYISLAVDETKLILKNLPESAKIIKLINAQTWLDENYSPNGVCQIENDDKNWDGTYGWNNYGKTRKKITKWSIHCGLEGNLDLSDFANCRELSCWGNKLVSLNISNCLQLEKICCESNLLTNLDVSNCSHLAQLDCRNNLLISLTLPTNPTNLKKLYLESNNFPIQDLSFLTPYINLEELRLGNWCEEKTNQNIYNRFTGSLDYLSNLRQLKELDITDTDINEVDIAKLPPSLEVIKYFTWLDCKLTEIAPQLEKHFGQHGRCPKCGLANTSNKWCQSCAEKGWREDLNRLTGQKLVKKFTKQHPNKNLCWIPYEQFTNIEFLTEGGFSKIYKAKWGKDEKSSYDRVVALKILKDSQNITLDFLTEVTNTNLVEGYGDGIVEFYGISRDPITQNYVMVMRYMEDGNLREYLKKKARELRWWDKFSKLWEIASGLRDIHEQNLIHHDLHSGNILNDYFTSCITDLGLSRHVNCQKQEGQIFGVLSYVAPEVLQGQPYTQEADIYSFGMIIYELLTGLPPFYNYAHDSVLAMRICEGLRPQFQIKIPQDLEELINECWGVDPLKRPSAEELSDILFNWGEEIWENDKDKKDTIFTQQVQEVETYNQTLSDSVRYPQYTLHPQASYYSKPINTKRITELLNSHNLTLDLTNLLTESNNSPLSTRQFKRQLSLSAESSSSKTVRHQEPELDESEQFKTQIEIPPKSGK